MSDTVKRYGKILVLIVVVLALMVVGWVVVTWSSAQPGQGAPGVSGSAVDYYVSTDGKDNNKGTSWKKAFRTIQKAIDTAGDGDTVWVAEGTYQEHIDFSGKAITISSVAPADPNVIEATIIDGGGSELITGHVVTFANNEDADSILTGFTITGGYASGTGLENSGAGIFCESASPTISNCIIADNHAEDLGGGIYLYQSYAAINDCLIGEYNSSLQEISLAGNSADYGGGVYCDYSSPIFDHCTIFVNYAENAGGGIYNNYSRPVLVDCLVWGNSDSVGMDELAQIYGGRPYVDYSFVQRWSGVIDPNGIDNNGDNPFYSPSAFLPDADTLRLYLGGGMIMAMEMRGPDEDRVYNEDQEVWYSYIQDAIDEANELDTITVYPGIYHESIYFGGQALTINSTDPDDPNTVAATIIDSRGVDSAVNFDGTEEPNSILSGFTITGSGSFPVALWQMDETTGSIAYDSTLYERDGTLKNMNNADWVTGKFGNALDFDGTNDYVDVDGYKGVTGTEPRTVSAWVKTSDYRYIISWGKNESNSGKKWAFMMNYSSGKGPYGAVRVSVKGGWITGSTDIRDNRWHYVAAVLPEGGDNVDDILLYVDGALETISSVSSKAINTAGENDVYIGANFDSAGQATSTFDGLMDEVRIYRRALSAAEIAAQADRWSHWKFDEDPNDSSGNKFNGTLHNFPADPCWTTGRINGALEFDGTDDYISAAKLLDPADGPFSAFGWIKVDNDATDISLIAQADGGGGYGRIWLHVDASGYLMSYLKKPGDSEITSTTAVNDGNWYHVGIVWDGQRRYLYVDGQEVAKDASDLGADLESSDGSMYIGRSKDGGATYWEGLIDDMRVFKRGLDRYEVLKLYHGSTAEGGIEGNGAQAKVSKCVIRNNYSGTNGGGVRNLDGTIANCVITRNIAYYYGGGLYDCDGVIDNCTIIDNVAYYYGGGVSASAEGDLSNSIIWGNYPNQLYDAADDYEPDYCDIQYWDGGGVGNISAAPVFENLPLFTDFPVADGDPNNINIFVYDAAYYEVDDVIEYDDDGVPRTVTKVDTTNNIITFTPALDNRSLAIVDIYNWGDDPDSDSTSDPNFVKEDYRLQSSSLTIDAGDPNADWSNEPDYPSGYLNMGAYGNTPEAAVADSDYFTDTDGDGIPDWWEDQYEFMDKNDPDDRDLDYDLDGLSNYQEFLNGTHPGNTDSDGDGMTDGWEFMNGLNAALGTGHDGANGDPDRDGLTNATEYAYGLDPGQNSEGNSWDQSEYDSSGAVTKQMNYMVYQGQVVRLGTSYNDYDVFGRVYRQRQTVDPEGDPNDATDRITLNVYDVQGRLIKTARKGDDSTDPNNTDPNSIDYEDDFVTQNQYNAIGRLEWTSDPNYYKTRYTYNSKGQQTKVERQREAGGSSWVTLSEKYYDNAGRLKKLKDAEGHYRRYYYDSLNRTIRDIAYDRKVLANPNDDVELMQTRTEYDGVGHVTRRAVMADPTDDPFTDFISTSVDMVTDYVYDPCDPTDQYNRPGMLISQKVYYDGGKIAKTEYFYDNLGRRSVIYDPNDNYIQNDFDVMNRVTTREMFDIKEQVVNVTTSIYDTRGRVIESRRIIDADLDYNNANNYLPTDYYYDGAGKLTETIAPRGQSTVYDYDEFDQRTASIADYGGIGQDTEYGYDRWGRQISITGYADDSTPQITIYDYDKLDRVTRITYPDTETIEYEYNHNSTVRKRIDQNNIITNYIYDNLGRMTDKDVTAGGVATEEDFTYDGLGRMLTASKDEDSSDISDSEFTYNGLGKVTLAKEKLFGAATATEIAYDYDQRGNLIEITYPDTEKIEINRDELGRIATITDDDQTPYTYAEYTYIGQRVASRTYPMGANDDVDSTISYNDLGQAMQIYTHNSSETIAKFAYTFDDNGNIVRQTFDHRASSPDNEYTYDDLDRLTEVDYHNDEDEEFTYDKLGNRENVKMREGGDVDYYVNDLVNQYAGIGAPPGHWKLNDKPGAYAIDATNDYDGTIHSANWTDSGKFDDALVFDGKNDYVTMDGGEGGESFAFAGVGGANPRTIAAWIDPNEAGVIASWGTDDSGGDKPVWNFVVATGGDFDFILGVVVNDSGAITGIGTGFDAGGGWRHAAVTFDGSELIFYINGNPSDPQTLSGVNTNADPYVYARIGKGSDDMGGYFEGLIDNVMIFDRVLSPQEIDSLAEAGNDNVLSVAATTYDKAGNLTVDYRGYKYSYDYENRLIEVKDNDDTSIVEYAYDALGRRIEKYDKIAGQKTRYYNNHDWQVLAEYDDAGYHLRSYIYGGYIDEVLVMVDPNAAEDYYYAHNHLYSPTALLDDAGNIIERYDYDAYGRPYFMEPNFALYETQKSNYNNTYLFTGRCVDILDNGKLTLQYNRNRYYDYHTGRWLTKDPKGNINGVNLYQYVSSNPLLLLDPTGQYEEGKFSSEGCAEDVNYKNFEGNWILWEYDNEYNPSWLWRTLGSKSDELASFSIHITAECVPIGEGELIEGWRLDISYGDDSKATQLESMGFPYGKIDMDPANAQMITELFDVPKDDPSIDVSHSYDLPSLPIRRIIWSGGAKEGESGFGAVVGGVVGGAVGAGAATIVTALTGPIGGVSAPCIVKVTAAGGVVIGTVIGSLIEDDFGFTFTNDVYIWCNCCGTPQLTINKEYKRVFGDDELFVRGHFIQDIDAW